jgi:nucleoside phosphorylase
LVKAELLEQRIAVSVSGPAARRGGLLAVIRTNFDHIHAGLAFRPEEMVPLPGHPQAVVPYQELLTWERAGRTEVERVFDEEVHTLDVPKLLGTVDFGRPRPRRLTGRPSRGVHPEDRPAEEAIDVGILMALKEEFEEFFPQIQDRCRPEQDPFTGDYYYHFEHPGDGGRPYRCMAAFVGTMGETDAGLLTGGVLREHGPGTLVWLGIGAGIDKDVKVGDVVAATEVESYAQDAKAVEADPPAKFTFHLAGQPYRPSKDLVKQVQNFPFAHTQSFADWQSSAREKLQSDVAADVLQPLLESGLVRERPAIHEGPMASGPFVGATTDFCAWVKSKNRKFLILEMESGGFLAAVSAATLPAHSLVLRGVSDYGDERKAQLDRIGQGVLRRYAMANAAGLLWKLLEAGVLPRAT